MRGRYTLGIVAGLLAACADNQSAPTAAMRGATRVIAGEVSQMVEARSQADSSTRSRLDKDGRASEFRREPTPSQASGAATAQSRVLRAVDEAALDTLERFLLQRPGKKGSSGALAVIGALRAPTTDEFHRRVRALPVSISYADESDASGRRTVRKTFTHSSGRTTSIVTGASLGEAAPSAATRGEGEAAADFELGESSEPPSQELTEEGDLVGAWSHAETDCSYTDSESNYWSGPCATEQDIEDAVILALSMDAENASMSSQISSEQSAYCAMHPEDYDTCANQDGANEVQQRTGGPNARCLDNCGARAWAFAGAAANYGYRSWKLWQVISAPAAPLSAIGDAIILGGIATAGVVAAGMLFSDCMQ